MSLELFVSVKRQPFILFVKFIKSCFYVGFLYSNHPKLNQDLDNKMPYQRNPSLISQTSQKPVNVFYIWYTELCRRLNSNPAPVVKPAKPKCQTVLNFVADRLKIEEWNPVINALRHDTSLHVIVIKSKLGNSCQFLHEIDTEDKLRQMKRRSGTLWTAFILTSLLKSLSCTVRNTQVLTCLEFDGLPMFAQYLEPLMKALQKNKTLKNLTLSRCRINDSGCQIVCAYVRFAPNIEILNLSGCSLTHESGQYLAKLIKYQQINRYCESWHNSLRYADPNIHAMRGIKRITLNHNPLIGNAGLDCILTELEDDLWIKALDMQNCGVTEALGMRIIDLVGYSQSLEIADFRLNEELSVNTINTILNILHKKTYSSLKPEYQWCNLSYTITCNSLLDTMSNYTLIKPPSVYKAKSAPLKQAVNTEKPVKKIKTVENFTQHNKKLSSTEKKLNELNNLLQEEIAKRKESEKINQELQQKLNEIISVQVKPKHPPTRTSFLPLDMLTTICTQKTNGVIKNGFHQSKNGHHLNGNAASVIFEKLLNTSGRNCIANKNMLQSSEKNNGRNGFDLSDSQISLLSFMESLKSTKSENKMQVSKYFYTGKALRKK